MAVEVGFRVGLEALLHKHEETSLTGKTLEFCGYLRAFNHADSPRAAQTVFFLLYAI
jgi:hypothetical protein